MTISSETNKSGPYTGNGVTTQFDFDFKIEEAAHLLVIQTDTSGVETTLASGAYQVALSADKTGTVTLNAPVATGEKITFLLNPPFTQLTDLPNQGAWNPEVVESALDKLTSCLLKLREEVSRSVKIKTSTDLADLDDLLADIEALADASADVKSLAGVKDKLVECADNIASIQTAMTNATNAANSATSAANSQALATTAKDLAEAAKLAAEAARDAAQAAQPISATTKGRELVAKDTAAEMRAVLGAASSSHNHSVSDLSDVHSNINLANGTVAEAAIPAEIARTADLPSGAVEDIRVGASSYSDSSGLYVTGIPTGALFYGTTTYAANNTQYHRHHYRPLQKKIAGVWVNVGA